MKHTCLFLFALCITACSKPVPAPMPDLPLPIEAPAVESPAAEAPKPDMGGESTGASTGANETPDAAPIFPASPTPSINVAVQTAK